MSHFYFRHPALKTFLTNFRALLTFSAVPGVKRQDYQCGRSVFQSKDTGRHQSKLIFQISSIELISGRLSRLNSVSRIHRCSIKWLALFMYCFIVVLGGFGVDFSSIDGSDEEYLAGIQKVATKLLSHGVTSFAPTLITSSADTYQRVCLFSLVI